MEIPYFKRWEYLPYNPESWHRQIAHTTHPVRKIISGIVSETSKSVLDVGCGTCTDYLFFEHTNVDYHGVDVTRKFADVAHKTHMVPNVTVGDVLHLPFSDNSFDTVYCKDLLEHLPPETWKKAVAELFRVATQMVLLVFFRAPTNEKPDFRRGETIGFYSREHNHVVEFGFWYNRYNTDEILRLLRELGAKQTRIIWDIRNLEHKESNSQTIFISWLK